MLGASYSWENFSRTITFSNPFPVSNYDDVRVQSSYVVLNNEREMKMS